MSVLELARSEIRALAPYSSARMEAGRAPVMLNANESPWPGARFDAAELNRYPDPQPAELINALAACFGVCAEQVLATRGSDEAIDLLTRAFCRAGSDSVLIQPPTFGMYAICARIQGANVIEVPLRADQDFAPDLPAILSSLDRDRPKLVYVCTPNNPTGGDVDMQTLESLIAATRGRAVLVVDEAYADYSQRPSLAARLAQEPHLAILRTLSKAHGLAGLRIGVLLAGAELVALLKRIIAPYPLPEPCVRLALSALDATALAGLRSRVGEICARREVLADWLQTRPGVLACWPSAANFLTFQVRNADAVQAGLARTGVVVRNVSRYPGLSNCLRVSIGSDAEMASFRMALSAQLEEVAA